MSSDKKILLLKKDNTEKIVKELLLNVTRSIEVLRDCLDGRVYANEETICQMCELIASSKTTTAALKAVFIEENRTEKDLFQIDELMLQGITSSLMLVNMLKEDLALSGFCLEVH